MSNVSINNTAPIKVEAPISTSAPKIQVEAKTSNLTEEQVLKLLEDVAALKEKESIANAKLAASATESLNIKEINWSKVNEEDIFDLDFPIEVIETEVPEYMNIFLADNNYVARWIQISPRHVGTKVASGWEYITEADWDPNKPRVLSFNNEGHLICEDVVAMKCYKSRYYAAIRRTHLKSVQLKNIAGYNKVKAAVNQSATGMRGMESAVNRGAISFYGENVESNIEVNI